MEFLRNGRPFLVRWVSVTVCAAAVSVGGSEVSLAPAGLFPVAVALFCGSVGATKDDEL